MTIQIGSRYLDKLVEIRDYILSVRNGGVQEENKVIETPSFGRGTFFMIAANIKK